MSDDCVRPTFIPQRQTYSFEVCGTPRYGDIVQICPTSVTLEFRRKKIAAIRIAGFRILKNGKCGKSTEVKTVIYSKMRNELSFDKPVPEWLLPYLNWEYVHGCVAGTDGLASSVSREGSNGRDSA